MEGAELVMLQVKRRQWKLFHQVSLQSILYSKQNTLTILNSSNIIITFLNIYCRLTNTWLWVCKVIFICCVKNRSGWRARSFPLNMLWWIQTKAGRFLFVCMFVDRTAHQASLGVSSRILHISCTFLLGTGSVWNLTGHANLSVQEAQMLEFVVGMFPRAFPLFFTRSLGKRLCWYIEMCVHLYVCVWVCLTDLNQIKT